MQTTHSDDRGSIACVTAISLIAALGGLLFGYDTAVINGASGFLETHFHLTCVVLVLVVALAVPETKGKSLEEIEAAWLARSGTER